jgi:hypothetical protein
MVKHLNAVHLSSKERPTIRTSDRVVAICRKIRLLKIISDSLTADGEKNERTDLMQERDVTRCLGQTQAMV